MAYANASFISNVTCNHSERKWSKEETEVLISWWEEYMSELRRLGRNTRTYIKISQRIQESFPSQVPRTQKEVQEKIKNLKKQYQHNKTKYGKTGSAPSPWVFFAKIHKFLGMLPVNDEGLMRQSAISIETVENDLVPGMEVSNVCELDPEYMTSTQIELDESLSVLSPMSLTVNDENKENETETDEFLSSFSTPARKRRKSTASEAIKTIGSCSKNFCGMSEYLNPLFQLSIENETYDSEERHRTSSKIMSLGKFGCRVLSSESSSSDSDDGLNILTTLYLNSPLPDIQSRSIWVKPKSTEWYKNVFPTLSDKDFKENFHVSRETYQFLITNLKGCLTKNDTRLRKSIPVSKRIAVSLYHLSSCGEYRVTANQFGIGKSTACIIVHEFVKAVNLILKDKFIEFPNTSSKLEKVANEFRDLHSLPQCVGAIDGCHIPVCPPKLHATDYYNYKGYYSIVLFAVVDARYKFTFINVGATGRNNDAKLLRSSESLWAILNSDLFETVTKPAFGIMTPAYLLGDSAFPLMTHLLKPYPSHKTLNEKEQYYNHKVCGVRRVVENAFGRVKARFRIIYKRMEGKMDFISQIVECCCTLNNICEYMNDEFRDCWRDVNADIHMSQGRASVVAEESAKTFRDQFAAAMFENRSY